MTKSENKTAKIRVPSLYNLNYTVTIQSKLQQNSKVYTFTER